MKIHDISMTIHDKMGVWGNNEAKNLSLKHHIAIRKTKYMKQ